MDINFPTPHLSFNRMGFMADVRDWFFGVYLPSIENPLLLNKTIKGRLHSFYTGGLDLIGLNASRVTFRFFDVKGDMIDQSAPFSPLFFYKRNFNPMDPKSGPMSGEFTSTIKNFINGLERPDWKYMEPGEDTTSYSAGGYVIHFDKGNHTENNQILKKWMFDKSVFSVVTALVDFDTIFYSMYFQCYVLCKHQFVSLSSGNILPQTIINVNFDFFFGF